MKKQQTKCNIARPKTPKKYLLEELLNVCVQRTASMDVMKIVSANLILTRTTRTIQSVNVLSPASPVVTTPVLAMIPKPVSSVRMTNAGHVSTPTVLNAPRVMNLKCVTWTLTRVPNVQNVMNVEIHSA